MDDVFLRIFKMYQPSPWICPCDKEISALIGDLTVYSMGVNHVTLNGRVIHDQCKLEFDGQGLWKQRCAHDVSHTVRFRVSDSQWNLAVSGASKVLILGARFSWTGDFIDATCAGVLNMDRDRNIEITSSTTKVVELFSGGISGWSHAIRSIPPSLCSVEMMAAIDCDWDCVSAYARTHGAQVLSKGSHLKIDFEMPDSHFAMCATVGDFSWLHVIDAVDFQLGVQSPPCPAWSTASDQLGVGRDDGQSTLHGWAIFSVLGTPVVAMENVAGMRKNQQWSKLVVFISALGYTIRWDVLLDLLNVTPQRRERLLIIATRTNLSFLRFHRCIPWPLGDKFNLASFQAILPTVAPWDPWAKIDSDVLSVYLDPHFMPSMANEQRTKKAKGDVIQFRLRFPSHTVSCFLASYSQAHNFAKHVLERNGLFGNLFVTDECIRFFTPSEVAIMMGLNHSFFLPSNGTVSFKMLGNCIAVGHASIAVLNSLAFLHPQITDSEIVACFESIMSERLHAGNIAWTRVDDGFWFTFASDVSAECIPCTVPTRDLISIGLHSPGGSFAFQCQPGIYLVDALKTILGYSHVSSFSLMIDEPYHVKIPLPQDFITSEHDLRVWTDGQCDLCIDPQRFRTFHEGTSHVVLLTNIGILVCRREKQTTVATMLAAVSRYLEADLLVPTDLANASVQPWRQLPTAMMVLSSIKKFFDASVWNRLKVFVLKDQIIFQPKSSDNPVCLQDFMSLLSSSQLLEFLMVLGWHFVQRLSKDAQIIDDRVILIPRAGFLFVPSSELVHCLATQCFLHKLQSCHTLGSFPSIECRFKLLGELVWTGPIDISLRVEIMVEKWREAYMIFGKEGDLRFLIQGKMLMLDRPFSDYITRDMIQEGSFVLQAILPLRGGGPLIKLNPCPPVTTASPSSGGSLLFALVRGNVLGQWNV